ncbi:MAG TPA: 1-phosphofructokinase family hexose kinase [Verrucomicrobiae bacterium]|nr:1-phosphofructokinase family hexose kinase [Verrucomicrobiae bacterium]
MILCIGTTPAAQRVMIFRKLTLDAVNRATTTLDGAAGKSVNVAKVLKALGEQPVAAGFLGGDHGEFLRGALAEKGIATDFVTVSTRTRQCITVIDESAGTQTELVEESRPVEPADFNKLVAVIRRRLPECRAVVMSGTIVTGGPVNLYLDCTRLAEDVGALSVVDGQGAALVEALKAKPGLVKPNRSELAATMGREFKNDADVMKAMHELGERGAQRVVVTAGKGSTLAFDGKNFWRVITPQIKPVNSIGSGDAFTAGLVSRLLRGDDLGEACRWGSAAGTANVLTPMPGEINREDIERLVSEAEVLKV